jgi:hypothetical protein
MELIERYLQAVKFWLPKEQKQDIIAELSADIYSQVEEKESELGRKLNDAEVEEILKQRGRPVLVANRYQPQQFLIGPVLFPIYTFALKVVACCYLLPWVVALIGLLTYSESYRTQHGGWLSALGQAWGGFWVTSLLVVGTVTVVFAVLEQVQAKSHFMEKWNPRKLPPVKDPNRIKRSTSIAEIVANAVFGVGWWLAYFSTPLLVNRPELRVRLTPMWTYFFFGFLCVSLANIALSAVNLAHPYWNIHRGAIRLVTDCAGSALFCWVLKVNIFAEITLKNLSTERSIAITNIMNLGAQRMFPLAVLLGLVIVGSDLYRIYRVHQKVKTRPLETLVAGVF